MFIFRNGIFDTNENFAFRISIHSDGHQQELHTHEFIEIELVLSGEGLQIINDVAYPIKTGDICFFALGDKHTFRCDKDLTILDIIIKPDFFYNTMINQEYALLSLPSHIRMPEKETNYVLNIMRLAMEEYDKKLVGYQTFAKSYIQILLATMFRNAAYSSVNPYSKINAILTYIENNFATVRLSSIAEEFNYSEPYFSRLFKRYMGMTFSQYIIQRRIKEAIYWVNFSDEKIESICTKIGYNDKTHFYKAFRNYTKTTPQKMREQCKLKNGSKS